MKPLRLPPYQTARETEMYAGVDLSMSKLFDLSSKCRKCGTGHLNTPCAGGARCMCRCRKCDARMPHAAEAQP